MAKKGGRPSKYQTDVEPRLEEVRQWAKAGATNKEMAAALGISVDTFCVYQNEFSEFSEAIRMGRMSGVPEVKTALLKLALGFEATETETEAEPGEDGKMHPVSTTITKRQIPPNLKAIEAYLRNASEEWADMDSTTRMVKEAEAELKRMMASMQGFRGWGTPGCRTSIARRSGSRAGRWCWRRGWPGTASSGARGAGRPS